jgi:hypothetical protein
MTDQQTEIPEVAPPAPAAPAAPAAPDPTAMFVEAMAVAYIGDPDWFDMAHETREQVLVQMRRAFAALQTLVMSLPASYFTPCPKDQDHA